MTLTEFLLSRFDEDEELAKNAPDWWADEVLGTTPGRVLAECEAKRRILDTHTYATEELRPTDTPGRFDRVEVRVPYAVEDEELLGIIAMPYADHPDYQQEWTP